jgi:ribonuclease P protein component
MMLVGVLKAVDEQPARIGFVTSKKVGGAVTRNRVRRRLRELVRHVRASFPVGTWIVIVAKPRASKATSALLNAEWTQLARKAGLIP